jgi:transcriptional regulator with PAS, ATPase and Fis domain
LWKNRIYVPSLRERGRADIQLLALDALEKVFKSEGLERSPRLESHFTPAALHFLYTYSWPGNVRELGDTLASKIIAELLCDGKRRVDVRDLEGQIFGDQAPRLDDGVVFRPATACVPPPVWNWERFSQWIEDIKVGYVNQALEVYGNYAQAAEALQVQRGTLYRYVPKKGKS